MSYLVNEDLSREDLVAAIETLKPFYAFGAVLDTANEENGHASVNLYNGDANPTPPEDFDYEQDLYSISPDGCIVGVSAGWRKTPATYVAPILQAKHFFAARDAFLKCVTPKERLK